MSTTTCTSGTGVAVGAAIMVAAAAAAADFVTLTNPGFENPPLANGGVSFTAPPGWTGSGASGVIDPSNAHTSGGIAPEGENVAWSNGGSLTQMTATPITPGLAYRLKVKVGARLDLSIPEWTISLRAGGEDLISVSAPPYPPSGGFIPLTLVYVSPPDDPFAGAVIGVRLAVSNIQALWDDVTLEEFVPFDADINDDGAVDGADITIILGEWGTGGEAADVDLNGVVDGGDIAFVLGAWTG